MLVEKSLFSAYHMCYDDALYKFTFYLLNFGCLLHGSETWPMKVEHELKLNRTEMSMIRWICGVKLNKRKKSDKLR